MKLETNMFKREFRSGGRRERERFERFGHVEERNNNKVVEKIGKIEVQGYRVKGTRQ